MRFPKLSSRFILAPMSGVCDVAFRALCRRYGAGLTTTELIAAEGLRRANIKTKKLVAFDPSEKPRSLQVFGSSAEQVLDAARLVEGMTDLIDLNVGCPSFKVMKVGCGSALMNNIDAVGCIVHRAASNLSVPFTVKIRAGVSSQKINCVEVAIAAESAGASAIAVHPRTAEQGYSGKADWTLIKKVKDAVSVPIIGNGDVKTPEDAIAMIEQTGCDYVMIGRAAIGNPHIFAQCAQMEKIGRYDSPNKNQKQETFLDYLDLANKYQLSWSVIKQQASNFTKGMAGATRMRDKIRRARDTQELKEVFSWHAVAEQSKGIKEI